MPIAQLEAQLEVAHCHNHVAALQVSVMLQMGGDILIMKYHVMEYGQNVLDFRKCRVVSSLQVAMQLSTSISRYHKEALKHRLLGIKLGIILWSLTKLTVT